ncbi:hypothetical protein D3C73_1393920 [compost metagenome]
MANPPHVDHILAYRVTYRRRVIARLDQLDTGRVFQRSIDFGQINVLCALQGHAIAIAKKHGGLNASDGNLQ